jgi:hypothetical protein
MYTFPSFKGVTIKIIFSVCACQVTEWRVKNFSLVDRRKNKIKYEIVKEAAPSALFPYILYIDLIRNVMHNKNIHMYITNGKPFHIYSYIYCIHLGQIA